MTADQCMAIRKTHTHLRSWIRLATVNVFVPDALCAMFHQANSSMDSD